jgi:hypothetical protein
VVIILVFHFYRHFESAPFHRLFNYSSSNYFVFGFTSHVSWGYLFVIIITNVSLKTLTDLREEGGRKNNRQKTVETQLPTGRLIAFMSFAILGPTDKN